MWEVLVSGNLGIGKTNYEEILIKLVNEKPIGGDYFENNISKWLFLEGKKESHYLYILGLR